MFRNKDIYKECKKHTLAVHQLQKVRDEWSKKRTGRLDFINETLKKHDHAISTFKDLDNAMHKYSLVTEQNLQLLEKEPQ